MFILAFDKSSLQYTISFGHLEYNFRLIELIFNESRQIFH